MNQEQARQSRIERLKLEREDQEEKERRHSWLILLLLLVPLCLCLISQLALSGLTPFHIHANLLSALTADYRGWAGEVFDPIDPALIATIRADQLTQAAGLGIIVPGLEMPFSNLDPGETQIADLQPTATPAPTRTSAPSPTIRPSNTPLPTNTALPTRSPSTATSVPTITLPPTITIPPIITAPPTVPPTPPTTTPTASPTVPPPVAITGVLRDDINYDGGVVIVGAGVCDATMIGVTVELYTGPPPPAGLPIQTTTTDATCTYQFPTPLPNGTYTVRVRSGSFPLGLLPEQTYGFGASALGGANPNIPDDHWVQVVYTGSTVTGVDFGFSHEVVVNAVTAAQQGSFEQVIRNVNTFAGANTIVFATVFGPYLINPPPDPGGFSDFTDPATTVAGNNLVTLDGAGGGGDGLVILAADVTIRDMVIRNFNQSGVEIGAVNNARLENLTLTNNIIPGDQFQGQINILGAATNGVVTNCVVQTTLAGTGGDGIRLASVLSSGFAITGNTISGSFDVGVTVRGTGHAVTGNTIIGSGGSGAPFPDGPGVAVLDAGSVRNIIRFNSIFGNGGLGIDLGGGAPNGVTPNGAVPPPPAVPNNYIDFPVLLGLPGGRQIDLTVPAGSTVDVYLSDNDPSGNGEGQVYCFTAIDGGANDLLPGVPGTLRLDLAALICAGTGSVIPAGGLFTSTATLPADGTSEFGPNLIAP